MLILIYASVLFLCLLQFGNKSVGSCSQAATRLHQSECHPHPVPRKCKIFTRKAMTHQNRFQTETHQSNQSGFMPEHSSKFSPTKQKERHFSDEYDGKVYLFPLCIQNCSPSSAERSFYSHPLLCYCGHHATTQADKQHKEQKCMEAKNDTAVKFNVKGKLIQPPHHTTHTRTHMHRCIQHNKTLPSYCELVARLFVSRRTNAKHPF